MSPYELEAKLSVELGGRTYDFDFAPDLRIGHDVDTQMDQVAAQIAWTGGLWGEAKKAKLIADAEYRAWRAATTRAVLDEAPKLAEWKVKAAIEADPGFMTHKRAIAEAERIELLMMNVVAGFKHKSELLRSRGAALRAEIAATGMHTKESPERTDAERKGALATALGKKPTTRRKKG